jgi:glucose/arabinose dehydrogenase
MLEVPGQSTMLLALQEGRILAFSNDPSASSFGTVVDQSARTSRDGNEEGLLGVALDPAFASNHHLYVYYSAKPGDRRTVLSRLTLTGSGTGLRADASSELVILTVAQPYSNHKGGQLAFGPDGMLYLGLGDGGSAGDPKGNGQDLKNNLLGSIIRIDVRGATAARPYVIPSDNPFAGATDGTRGETWAYGLRNPWRFAFDRVTGVLIAGDVGQGDREEVNVVLPGKNYGWNVMEGSACYRRASCDSSGLTPPVFDYDHSNGNCSITGGFVYRGQSLAATMGGSYVFADHCSGKLWVIADIANGGEREIDLPPKLPHVTSFAEDARGELYALTLDGAIYRLVAGN